MQTQNFAINSDFVAFRKGEFVSHSVKEKAGEFILNAESDFTVSTLKEIIDANDLDVSKSIKKDQMLAEILSQLDEKEISEMSEEPQSVKVQKIVKQGYADDLSEDDILVNIVQSGVKYRAAMKLMRSAEEELGLRLTAKGRNEYVEEVLGDDFEPKTPEEMAEAIDKIAEHDAITPQQARSSVRRYLKQNEREVPKVVRQAASGGMRAKIFDFIAENPAASVEDLSEAISQWQDDPEKVERATKRNTPVLLLANRIASNLED